MPSAQNDSDYGVISRKKGGAVMNTNALNNVYNYYLTTYSTDSSSPFDSHKKSELRNIYNSMVKLNKESPIYLLDTSTQTKEYAVGVKENARQLRNTIASLGGLDEEAMLNKKVAFSSNESIATANYIGEQTNSEDIPSFELEVHSLASSQVNLSKYLPSDVSTGMTPDTYSFDLSINDLNYEFQFNISAGETNGQVFDRLSNLINNSNVGISAEILTDDKNNSALKLTSAATGLLDGKEQLFKISDDKTSKTAGAVEHFGLDYIATKASNSDFSINGEERSSYSNKFTVAKTYELTLTGVSPSEGETTTIGTKTDVESIAENISQMVRGYNHFVESAASFAENYPRSERLVREMNGIAKLYQSSFESFGLNLKDNGSIDIDKRALSQGIESSDMQDYFSTMKNFTSSLLRKSNQISLDPMKYVDKKVVAYKNPGKNFPSPYTSSMYSGMMFNYYC